MKLLLLLISIFLFQFISVKSEYNALSSYSRTSSTLYCRLIYINPILKLAKLKLLYLNNQNIKYSNIALHNLSIDDFELLSSCSSSTICKVSFESTKFNISKNVLTNTLTVKTFKKLTIAPERYYLSKLTKGILESINTLFIPPNASFVKALILGIRDQDFISVYQNFIFLGISHLITISGFHFAFIFLLANLTISFFTRLTLITFSLNFNSILITKLASLLIMIFYFLLLPTEIPITRAFIMIVLISISIIFPLQVSPIKSFLFSLLLVLFLFPSSLTEITFYFSFTSVLALIVWNRISQYQLANSLILNRVLNLIATSLFIYIFTAPIALFYFQSLPLLSILYNIIFIPLTGLLMAVISLGLVLPFKPILIGCNTIIDGYLQLLAFFSKLNQPYVQIDYMSISETIILSASLLSVSLMLIHKRDFLIRLIIRK